MQSALCREMERGGKMSTAVEKIFSRKLKRPVHAGEIVIADVDCSMMHDVNGPVVLSFFKEFQVCVRSPERALIALDHLTPCPSIGAANHHKELRDFAREQGIELADTGQGVCHQSLMVSKKLHPGCIAVGTDSHCAHYGALNCFSTGVGASEEAVILASDQTWFRVPETVRVEFCGTPDPLVTAKDLALEMIRRLGETGALYRCLEFGGDALKYLSVEERSVICNLAIEVGAKGAIMPFDGVLEDWMKQEGMETAGLEGVSPDEEAVYFSRIEINVSELEPLVAIPPLMSNVERVSELERIALNQVVIGSCTNGNYEDFEAAARILKGKKIDKGVRLLIVPALASTIDRMVRTGIYQILLEAGATVLPASCGPCAGLHGGLIADGENVLSTTNRNLSGRMGSRLGKVYIASPVTAACSALAGYISAEVSS